MSVEIHPSELAFRRPFSVEEITQVLRISNPNSTPVAFKVKTTAPKQYCVRPNSGRIEPGHDVEVIVALQVMKAEPAPDAKCRDKFLVQAVPITSDKEFANVASILDTADKSLFVERKIKVSWLSADGESEAVPTTPARRAAGANTSVDTPDASSNLYTDSQSGLSASHHADDLASDRPSSNNDTAPSVVAAVPVPAAAEDWKRRAVEAENQLRSYVDRESSGLRQRGNQAVQQTANVVGATAQQARDAPTGVRVQIVAALCLVSFLLAYFLF